MSKTTALRKVRHAYKFIESHSNEFNVTTMCRGLGVERSGYYVWLRHPISDRAQEDTPLLIDPSFLRRKPRHLWCPGSLARPA